MRIVVPSALVILRYRRNAPRKLAARMDDSIRRPLGETSLPIDTLITSPPHPMLSWSHHPWTVENLTTRHSRSGRLCAFEHRRGSFLTLFLFTLLFLICTAGAQTTVPQWRVSTALPQALCLHRSVLLHTGEVLVCGGKSASGAASNASYLFKNGAWSQTVNLLSQARFDFSLVAVRNTKGESVVFAIGGYTGASNAYSSVALVEMLSFDAATKSWSWRNIGNLPVAVGGCAAAYDAKAAIFVSGGRVLSNAALSAGVPSVVSARIDVNTLGIQRIGDMATARSEHATLMLFGPRGDSTVLSACGESSATPATEILNANVWDARANPPAMEHVRGCTLTDRAAVARMFGGFDASNIPTNKGEWYDTKSGWRAMPRMQTARARAAWCMVAGTKDTANDYLVVSGESVPSATATCELYSMPDGGNPNGAFAPFATGVQAAADRTIAIQQDNLPLVCGGNTASVAQSSPLTNCEIYQPLQANDLNFGQEEIGRESDRTLVTFQNTWLLPVMLTNLRIPGSAEFRLTSALDSIVIAPGGSVQIDVRFRPGIIGIRQAELLANIGALVDTVKLSGEGIKSSITVLSAAVDFGARLLKSDSIICFAAIRNDGKDTTVIDSVVINPPGEFTVISPIGRTKVAPDSTMTICVQYHPTIQQHSTSSTEIHISDRLYPVAVTGQGLRRFIVSTQQLNCDTVSVAPGDSISYQIIVSNTSDLAVHCDSTLITTSLAGTFHPAQPSPFPFDLAPGATRTITIVFAPQREAKEQGIIAFINNGDTLCATTLCFIPRNRNITINTPQSSALTVCEGDSLTIPIVLENPSSFDALVLDSVYVTGVQTRVNSFVAQTLKPHANTTAELTFVPQTSGQQTATVVVLTNQGQSQTALSLNVQPALRFSIDNATGSMGGQVLLRVHRSDILSTNLPQTTVQLVYDGSMLSVVAIQNANGRNYLDIATSSFTNAYGVCTLNLRWNQQPTQADEVFDLLCDVLRGDAYSSSLNLQQASVDQVCVQSVAGTLDVQAECGGQNALIDSRNGVRMMMTPMPANDKIDVHVTQPDQSALVLRMVNSRGETVYAGTLNSDLSLDTQSWGSGLYLCILYRHDQLLLRKTLTIVH